MSHVEKVLKQKLDRHARTIKVTESRIAQLTKLTETKHVHPGTYDLSISKLLALTLI